MKEKTVISTIQVVTRKLRMDLGKSIRKSNWENNPDIDIAYRHRDRLAKTRPG
jgi:hypothetical protein